METSRTKAQEYDIAFKTWKHDIKYTVVDVDFARQLETELAEAQTQLEQMDDERLSWKTEAELRGKALAEVNAENERLKQTVLNKTCLVEMSHKTNKTHCLCTMEPTLNDS